MTNLTLPFLAALLFSVTGCASTGQSRIMQPVDTKLSQFKTATVSVKSAVPKPPEKIDEFMAQLESRIIAKLRGQAAFEKVYPAAADSVGELQISVTITSVRDIDPFTRLMWGAFAGQANAKALVELRDRGSGKLLGSAEVEGKSSGGTVFAGTTPESVDRVADEVVRIIRENS